MPKGALADHWTWGKSGRVAITGWHYPAKRGKQQPEDVPEPKITRGVVATAQRERAKDRQGQLL